MGCTSSVDATGNVTMTILTEKLGALQSSIIKFIQSTCCKISNNNLINDENYEESNNALGELLFVYDCEKWQCSNDKGIL